MLSTKPVDTRHLTFRYSGTAEHYEYDRDTENPTSQFGHADTALFSNLYSTLGSNLWRHAAGKA